MLAAGNRRDFHVAIVRDVRRRVELADEGNAGDSVFGAQQHRGLLAPDGFAMHLPCLPQYTSESQGTERIAAAIIAGDESCVKSAH